MVEFRTRAVGQEADDSGGGLESHIERVIENVQNSPEIKKQLMKAAQENDVNPVVLQAIVGDSLPNVESTQDMSETTETQVETEVKTVQPNADQVIGFLEEIIDLTPEGMTLEELKDWADENPDVVQTAIEMRF